MNTTAGCPLASALAQRLRADRDALAERWLERICDRVDIEPGRIFPSEELLDHVPVLIDGIADYLEDPASAVAGDPPVIGKAMELGALRYEQGVDEYEILKEYELFGGILFAHLSRSVEEIDQPCSRSELLSCAHRVFHAVSLITQATATQYLRMAKQRLAERERRLRTFNSALTHELKNHIGAALGGAELLGMEELAAERRAHFLEVIVRNVDAMRTVLDNLLELSRVEADARRQRRVRLEDAVAESVRQLRDAARARGVRIEVSDDLPDVEVPAAAVELGLANLLSNAIKYAAPERADRWARVRGWLTEGRADRPAELVVEVRDNGVGVPEEERGRLFERFFRSGTARQAGIEGTGIGLSIVRETVESLGGRVWAEFLDEGTAFRFALPARREADRATPGAPPAAAEGR